MNAAHYQNLIKTNALSDDLARRIEVRFPVTRPRYPNAILTSPPLLPQAYKVVAASSE